MGTENDDEGTPNEGGPGTGDPTVAELLAERDKWKRQARDNESRAKSNAEAAKRLEEIENEGKSEVEKLTAQLAATNEKLAGSETALARIEVGIAKGLTPQQAKRLAGTTREEFEADADDLLKLFGSKPTGDEGDDGEGGDEGGDGDEGGAGVGGGRPTPNLEAGTGNPGAGNEGNEDIRKIVSEIPRV